MQPHSCLHFSYRHCRSWPYLRCDESQNVFDQIGKNEPSELNYENPSLRFIDLGNLLSLSGAKADLARMKCERPVDMCELGRRYRKGW